MLSIGGFREFAGLQCVDDRAVAEMGLHGVEIGLVEHGNQDGPRGQVAQNVYEHAIAAQLRQPNMEIAHQAGQPLFVGSGDRPLLLGQMGAQPAALLGELAHAAQQAGLDDAPAA